MLDHIARDMSDKEKEERLNLFKSALKYVCDRVAKGKMSSDVGYPFYRGDILLLVMLIEQELRVAPSDWKEPLNAKRLAAIREKLGDMAGNAPEMSKAEAQQFRE